MTEILAIDDDREILAVIKKALLREGYQVTALEDPLQLEEDKLGRYQLILLDVMMPGIDGFDLCRRIREKVDCPILFLTAKTEEKDVMTGLGAGGDDYITKPFGIGELRARVAAHTACQSPLFPVKNDTRQQKELLPRKLQEPPCQKEPRPLQQTLCPLLCSSREIPENDSAPQVRYFPHTQCSPQTEARYRSVQNMPWSVPWDFL